jgi:HSP20 family molecular chaperone IbpA
MNLRTLDFPAMDLVHAGEHYVVKADLPGMTERT